MPMGVAAGVGALFVFLMLGLLSHTPDISEVFAMRAKRRGACPACGYPILGLPTSDDGLVTCPECAGKWLTGSQPRTTSSAL